MAMSELITAEQVAKAVGVSVLTIQRWVKAGDFPPPLRFGRRIIRWRVDTINTWLAERSTGPAQEATKEEHVA
jgi:excisionase family DNA binding protein